MIIFYFFEIAVLIFLYFILPEVYYKEWLISLLLLNILNISLFVYRMRLYKHITKIAFPTILFLISYVVVYFQRYLDLLLGFITPQDDCFCEESVILRCAIISTIGLTAFFLGSLIPKRTKKKEKVSNIPKRIDKKVLDIFILFFFILYVYFNQWVFQGIRYSQELLEQQAGTMALYSAMLIQITFFLHLTYTIVNLRGQKNTFTKFRKECGLIFNTILILYIIFVLLSGDRGPVIIIASAYAGAMLISRVFISKWIAIPILLLSGYTLYLIGVMRNIEDLSNVNQNETIFKYSDELAGSVNTLHYAVYNVPSEHPYLYGSFQLRAIASSIPFLGRVVDMFADPGFQYHSSAFFITWLIQGDYYTYGSGTSCNADLYLSFGIWGVLIGMLLLGYVFRYNQLSLRSRNLSFYSIILYLYVIGYALYIPRATVLSFFNFFIFTLLLHYLYKIARHV